MIWVRNRWAPLVQIGFMSPFTRMGGFVQLKPILRFLMSSPKLPPPKKKKHRSGGSLGHGGRGWEGGVPVDGPGRARAGNDLNVRGTRQSSHGIH